MTARPRELVLALLLVLTGFAASTALMLYDATYQDPTPQNDVPSEASPDFGISTAVAGLGWLLPVIVWLIFAAPTLAAAIGAFFRVKAARVVLIVLLGGSILLNGTCSIGMFTVSAPDADTERIRVFGLASLVMLVTAVGSLVLLAMPAVGRFMNSPRQGELQSHP